jgi:hypothetical protein
MIGLIFSAFSDPVYTAQVFHRESPGVWAQLGIQLLGATLISVWSALWSYLFFNILTKIKTSDDDQPNLLRIPLDLEEWGADLELNWGIGRTKLKRTLAEYLSRVQNELPAADPLDEVRWRGASLFLFDPLLTATLHHQMNNEAYLNLPTSKAVLRFVVDHYKPYFIKQDDNSDDEEPPDSASDTPEPENDDVVSYSMSSKSD